MRKQETFIYCDICKENCEIFLPLPHEDICKSCLITGLSADNDSTIKESLTKLLKKELKDRSSILGNK